MNALRCYVFLFIWLKIHNLHGQTAQGLLNQYFRDASLSNAQNSLLAVDLNTGDTLLNFQSNLATITASTTKIFSTAMALELLGSDYRFSTECYLDGPVQDNLLKGNVWIRGLGDVSFGSRYFYAEGQEVIDFMEIVQLLKKQGIKKIQGAVYIDGSSFGYEGTPSGWSDKDVGNYYGAFPSGINFYDNAVNYYFATGEPGRAARFLSTYPVQSKLKLQNKLLSAKVRGDNSNIQGKAYNQFRLVSGKLPANQSSFVIRGSVADPELNFADAFSRACESGQVSVSKGVVSVRLKNISIPDYDAIKNVGKIEGRTVGEIVEWTNRKSVNFFAEGLLNGVAYQYTGCGSNSNGLKVYRQYLASRMDTTGLKLFDGSGLSRNNRISAAHLCRILTYVYRSEFYSDFRNSLPIAGKSGTIQDLCVGQAGENRVFAKSGTMIGIKSYAGYIYSATGKTIVFSFISSGHSCSQSHVKNLMQGLMNGLAAL
jgi:D-alanyl-D-alanine carboxypeptidase/D-alanyl-D-alanine-endopeptidase (penicillin-binding protein 4)